MRELSIRDARQSDAPAILALADRLADFGLTARDRADIARKERKALADVLSRTSETDTLLVAEQKSSGIVGVVLLEDRRDYFTDESHGHVSILAVAREVEGQGVGRALLRAAEEWGRTRGFRRLTLSVFADNRRAKALSEHQGWQPELEAWYKILI